MTDIKELKRADNAAFDKMQRANNPARSIFEANVRLAVAIDALDQYYDVVEIAGRQVAGPLWNAYNPWDFRRIK